MRETEGGSVTLLPPDGWARILTRRDVRWRSTPGMSDTCSSRHGAVTGLLHRWSGGDRAALDALIPLVHDQLTRVARRSLARERPAHTIQPTALVNEAYIRLVKERGMVWQDRTHFLAVAAQLMRFILVDHARRRQYQKRGGSATRVTLDMDVEDQRPAGILAINGALDDLEKIDPRKVRVVEMRVFGGLTVDESARLLGVSPETIGRDWRFARAWLQRELTR
jgi:RNA polymerase sigma-70 factor (ECF subfamily)